MSFEPLVQRSKLPQLNVKLLFRVGSAHDPKGKEGLAALAAEMIADAGSRAMTIDEIKKALFPMAASLDAQVDKEMTTFTARVHRDNWERFAAIALPQLEEPGFREEDFRRLKDQQKTALVEDLRTNNEEELGKERLQALAFAGHALRAPGARHRGRDRGDHARRREGLRAPGLHARRAARRALGGPAGGRRGAPRPDARARCRKAPRSRRPRASSAARSTGSRSRSSRRRRAPPRSRSVTRSPSTARTRTSRRSTWPAPGSASTAPRPRTSTSASARCAG